jgi:hypothetical protein
MNNNDICYAIIEKEYKQIINSFINCYNYNSKEINNNKQKYNNRNNNQYNKRKICQNKNQFNNEFINNKTICNRKRNNNVNNNRNNNMNNNRNNNMNNRRNNNMNNKQNYHFSKSDYNFILSKTSTNTFIIYTIKHNHNINEIKFPKHLYSITNDNYIYDKLLNIINNTNSLAELNIQWNIISNIIDNISPISSIKSFINNFNNIISNLN